MMSEMIKSGSAFIEQKCCIEHEGQKFCSGGSWLCVRKDTGKMEGILYGNYNKQEVSSWDGTLKIPAIYGREYRNNFGALCQSVYFRYDGKYFYGRWLGKDWSQIVRVREITKRSYFH